MTDLRGLGLFIVALLMIIGANAEEETLSSKAADISTDKLLNMSFEELAKVTITSSARRPQPISRSSSAIYVITAEDIRLAGVQKLDDILRLVPGMDVAHVSTAGGISFASSARGFARPSSEKMQVLVDGRSLYNPFRAGVELGVEPIFHENIERIEVIRGSGGVVWGVNAMNGVINIITKKAVDTQGGLLSGGFGNRETGQGFLRYGESTENLSWRLSLGGNQDNGFGSNHGKDIVDDQEGQSVTGRVDYQIDHKTTIDASFGHRESELGFGLKDPIRLSLQYANIILKRQLNEGESIQLRWSENFYDRE
jgi:iron complex outermembrane recepter protein